MTLDIINCCRARLYKYKCRRGFPVLDENMYYLILSIVVMRSINVVAIYAVGGVRVSHNDHCQPIEGINILLSEHIITSYRVCYADTIVIIYGTIVIIE